MNATEQPSEKVLFPSPRNKFQMSRTRIENHQELVASQAFNEAIDAATLEYNLVLTRTTAGNFNDCAANHLKAVGVTEFVAILRRLAEKQQPIIVEPIIGLNHKA